MAGPEGGSHPRYSPDGRWFWTGEVWIPASQVLRERPEQDYRYTAPGLPAPVRAMDRIRRWPVVCAAALLVALIFAGVGNYVLDQRS
ncbi:MAG: hypothetical protein J2P38_07035, partial [Candidatus Dormibacteraeota bacterium]|nr:hypothetical protein [Candidatus Dormibacteraeota bacterium]